MNLSKYKASLLITGIVIFAVASDFFLTTVIYPWIYSFFKDVIIVVNFWNRISPFSGTLGPLAITMFFLWLYDRFVWRKYPILVNSIYVKGRYKGIQFTSHDSDLKLDVVIEIEQKSASMIFIQQFTHNTKTDHISISSSAHEITKINNYGELEVIFVYENEGKKIEHNIDQHQGCCILKISPKTKSLRGYYFTNREAQTKGEISAKFESESLKGDYHG